MIIVNDDLITLKIEDEVINKMKKFIQNDSSKPESGGILMGYFIEPTNFVITDLSFPNSSDKSSRFSFIRSKKSAQKIVNETFELSGGKKIYLGEWHTHPEDYPTPSSIDNKSIKKQLHMNVLNSDTIFMIIIGTNGFHISKVVKNSVSLISNNQY